MSKEIVLFHSQESYHNCEVLLRKIEDQFPKAVELILNDEELMHRFKSGVRVYSFTNFENRHDEQVVAAAKFLISEMGPQSGFEIVTLPEGAKAYAVLGEDDGYETHVSDKELTYFN